MKLFQKPLSSDFGCAYSLVFISIPLSAWHSGYGFYSSENKLMFDSRPRQSFASIRTRVFLYSFHRTNMNWHPWRKLEKEIFCFQCYFPPRILPAKKNLLGFSRYRRTCISIRKTQFFPPRNLPVRIPA